MALLLDLAISWLKGKCGCVTQLKHYEGFGFFSSLSTLSPSLDLSGPARRPVTSYRRRPRTTQHLRLVLLPRLRNNPQSGGTRRRKQQDLGHLNSPPPPVNTLVGHDRAECVKLAELHINASHAVASGVESDSSQGPRQGTLRFLTPACDVM